MTILDKIRLHKVNKVFKNDSTFKIWFGNRLDRAKNIRETNKMNYDLSFQCMIEFVWLNTELRQIEERMDLFRKLFKVNYPPKKKETT